MPDEEWPDDLLPRKPKDEDTFMPKNNNDQKPPVPPEQMPPQSPPYPVQQQPQPQVQPESSESSVNVEYAGFWIRLVALIIDGIIGYIIGRILIYVFPPTMSNYGFIMSSYGFIMSNVVLRYLVFPFIAPFLTVAGLIGIIIMTLYYFLMTGTYGATLGKMVVHIKVVDENYQKPSYGTAALRELLAKAIVDRLTFNIGDLFVCFTEEKRALHDMIAKTYVIYDNRM